jgi:hypothetical protein
MIRRSIHLILPATFFLASTLALAQHSSPGGGHASSAPSSSSSSSAPSYSPPPSNSSSHSSPPSYSGGSSSHSNSGGSTGASHSGGWSHSGGSSNNTHTTNSGGSPGRSDHNFGGNRAPSHSNRNDSSRSDNQFHRPDSRPARNSQSLESAPDTQGKASRGDTNRNQRFRNSDIDPRRQRVNAGAIGQSETEHRSRASRIFLFWKHSPKSPQPNALANRGNPDLKRPNPCKGADCKPVCPSGQTLENGACGPSRKPQGNVQCAAGTTLINGSCQSDNTYDSNNRNRTGAGCTNLSMEIDGLTRQLQTLYDTRNQVCASGGSSTACSNVTNQIAVLEQRLALLRQQYASCVNSHP